MEDLDRHLASLASTDASRPLDADVDVAAVGNYHGYAALVAAWSELAAAGARPRVVGRSVRGQPLFALEVGPEDARRASVVLAGMHPIEWIGVEVGLALFGRLVRSPPARRRVIGFPLINVDGYRQVEADLRSGRRRFRRGNHHGVDLNRNWPTHFRRGRGGGRLQGWNKGGPSALSEPETAAVAAHCEGIAENAEIDAALSLHSFGRMILYPFGGRWAPPDRVEREKSVAASLRSRMSERYRVRQSARWVPGAFAHGMEIDHLRSRYGATSLLVECSLGGLDPWRPASWVHPFRWFNPSRPGRVAEELAGALEPFVRGEVAGEVTT